MTHVQTFKHKSIFYTTVNDDTCDLPSATQKLKKNMHSGKESEVVDSWEAHVHVF